MNKYETTIRRCYVCDILGKKCNIEEERTLGLEYIEHHNTSIGLTLLKRGLAKK